MAERVYILGGYQTDFSQNWARNGIEIFDAFGGTVQAALDAVDLEPEAVATLHPRELRRLDVSPGGIIRVATRRGAIELAARADRDVPEGMIFIPFCFAEAAANLLTNPQLDPWGKIPEFKFCAAKVENAERSAAE